MKLTFPLPSHRISEPIPALSTWQRDGFDSDEARLSPQAGRLIRQLLDGDSDPMLSPRFYAYGQSQQYLDDTEVPPSPPNSHSFMRWVAVSELPSEQQARGFPLCYPVLLYCRVYLLSKIGPVIACILWG